MKFRLNPVNDPPIGRPCSACPFLNGCGFREWMHRDRRGACLARIEGGAR